MFEVSFLMYQRTNFDIISDCLDNRAFWDCNRAVMEQTKKNNPNIMYVYYQERFGHIRKM